MSTEQKNKVAIVTGGGSGIGLAIATKFVQNDILTIIVGRDEIKLKATKEKLGNLCVPIACDLSDLRVIPKLVQDIVQKYGQIDILVNNAGITTPVAHNDLDGLTDEWIDKIFTTNFRGSFSMIRVCKELLMKSGNGLVINISSVAAITGVGSNVAYCASKAAIDSMTRSLARALAPTIRVVSVSPGWVMGEYTKNIDPAYLQSQLDATPLARLATPEDVANAVYAVAATLTFSTGCIIPVDGGRPLK